MGEITKPWWIDRAVAIQLRRFRVWLEELKATHRVYKEKGVSQQARLIGTQRIVLGRNVRIHSSATIDCRRDPYLGDENLGESEVIIGNNSTICSNAMLLPYGGRIVIGDNCTVNPFTILYGHGGLTIGNNTRIACHSVLIPAEHVFEDPESSICTQGLKKEGITIGNDVWIGANVTVLDGVTINDACVVAAQSVVTKSFPSHSVLAGVPARVLKKRNAETVLSSTNQKSYST